MNKNRLEAFSDGVFAIVITLLVLDIHLPNAEAASNHELLEMIRSILPSILTYIFTFLVVGIFWVAHHRIFNMVGEVDSFLLFGNIFYLMTVVLIPFPAALLAKHPHLASSIIIYSSLLGAIGIQHLIFVDYIHRHSTLQHSIYTQRLYAQANRIGLVGPCCYAIACITSLIHPYASFVFILTPLVFYIGFASKFYRKPI